MKKFLFWLAQWTWGFPQNVIGLFVYLAFKFKNKKDGQKCKLDNIKSRIFITNKPFGGIGLGGFIVVDTFSPNLIFHEYGHSIQSLIFGPLFLFIIGIPSLIWAGCFGNYRKKKNISYYSFYTESLANKLTNVNINT